MAFHLFCMLAGADELKSAAADIASSLASGLTQAGEDGELAGDANEIVDGLKETFAADFETRRRMLSAHMGSSDGKSNAAAANIEKRVMAQKDTAMQLFAGIKTPAEAMQVIRDNPDFVETLEGVVIDSVEDLIKGITIPAIAGETPEQK